MGEMRDIYRGRIVHLTSESVRLPEVIHLFIATGLTRVSQALGADEVIDDVRAVRLVDALAMIAAGEIRDAKTIAALVQADLRQRGLTTTAGGGSKL